MDKEIKGNISKMEEKMNSYVDKLLGVTEGMVKTAHPNAAMTNQSYRRYRSSFLTLSDTEIPDDYREIFRWCRYFFKFDALIGSAVRSLSTFPVTDWILNDTEKSDDEDTEEIDDDSEESSETYKFYKSVLETVDLYKHMIEVGYDYFLYGNCIIFAEPGVKVIKRRDPSGTIFEKKEVVWKHIQRLDVTRLRIERNQKTNEKEYYYDIPPRIKRIIQTQKPKKKYDEIPEIFKKAVQQKGLLKLKSDYVYHLQMPSESGDEGLWATPPVLHVMKLILYMNVLRQAQEAIAHEHIIPKRLYYFQETNEVSPVNDFEGMSDDFAQQLKRQLDDPNYQIISPVPVELIQQGGEGKSLLLVPEIEQLQETILAGMGVPKEFVFGGLSYSGSTTSLRILENHFITYRTTLLDYINNFLIKRLAEIRGEWETIDDDEKLVNVTLNELKMQDDIQQKQLMINLNEQGKLPDEIMYEKVLGLDSTKVIKQLQAERLRKLQEQADLQVAQSELQEKLQSELAARGHDPAAIMGATPNSPEVTEPASGAYGGPVAEEQTKDPNAKQPQDEKQQGHDGHKYRNALKIAQALIGMNEAQRANAISKLPEDQAKPALMIYNKLKADMASGKGKEEKKRQSKTDMRPYPEQRPPRRTIGGV